MSRHGEEAEEAEEADQHRTVAEEARVAVLREIHRLQLNHPVYIPLWLALAGPEGLLNLTGLPGAIHISRTPQPSTHQVEVWAPAQLVVLREAEEVRGPIPAQPRLAEARAAMAGTMRPVRAVAEEEAQETQERVQLEVMDLVSLVQAALVVLQGVGVEAMEEAQMRPEVTVQYTAEAEGEEEKMRQEGTALMVGSLFCTVWPSAMFLAA